MTELGDSALQYAGRGWHIFPLSPNSKLPFKGSHGFKDATNDVAIVEAWWGRAASANIGLSCGWHESGPNLVVLDADGAGGLARLRSLGGDPGAFLPETLAAVTPRGGIHLFYRLPADVRLRSFNEKRTEKGGDGLDVKADGGFVVLAPSRVKGGAYSWANNLPIAELDAREIAAIERLRPVRATPTKPPAEAMSLGPAPEWIVGGGFNRSTGDTLENAFISSELPDFLQALKQIPVTLGYDTWFRIGAAIHDFLPGPDGLMIFKAWSKTCSQYQSEADETECERKWNEYERREKGRVKTTKATVYALAIEQQGRRGQALLDGRTGLPVPDKGGVIQNATQLSGGLGGLPTGNGAPANTGPSAAQSAAGGQAAASGQVNGNGAALALPAAIASPPGGRIWFPDLDGRGVPKPTCKNARTAIRGLGIVCENDVWHGRMYVGGQAIGQWAGELTDGAVQMLRVFIDKEYHFDPGSVATYDGATQEALLNPRNPVLEYLDGLEWDGVPRLDGWMAAYLGAERSVLNDAIARLGLVAAVRRARRPGCKFDQIIVLEGPEGRGKSSAIEILAGSTQFSDQSILMLDDKGQQEALAGVWLYEIADLAGHSRSEVEKVKAFASRTVDRARPAYGRSRQDIPRRCVFFATTNNDTYLQSVTGNRRFWPVTCGHVDLEGLKRDRDQLWAEAANIEARGNSLQLPERLWVDAAIVQDSRRDHDPWEDDLAGVKGKLNSDETEWRVSSWELMHGRLGLAADRRSAVTAKRLVSVMRRLGWEGPKLLKDGDVVSRGYWKPAK